MTLQSSLVHTIINNLQISENNEVGSLWKPSNENLIRISNDTQKLLEQNLQLDIDLFRFIRRRFYQTLQALHHGVLTYVTHSRLPSVHFEHPARVARLKAVMKKYGYVDRGCMGCTHAMDDL